MLNVCSIGARGYFFFLLFQCFINRESFSQPPPPSAPYKINTADLDGLSDAPGKHVYQSLVLGQVGPYIRLPSHSFLVNMGPQTSLLMLDCR